ncbi:FkbM family methyltransferase [uncultured Tateyamaria sp.]|uniref:FkbM family methyltransferase n=1 Tax=uncultured Tateyamaria sp. TaxID=455651 RepID=UPI00262E5FD5|nr:FkbM family methyltransferase [uncultured Tateyamaria sp.]
MTQNSPPASDPIARTRRLCDALRPARLTRLVDIGANPINPAPYDALLEHGLLDVVAFEPHPQAFEEIQAHPKKNQTVYPYAIGDGTRQTLNVHRYSGFTSLLPFNPEVVTLLGCWDALLEPIDTPKIDTHRLDDLPDIGPIDMLKIDIQGAEQQVFQHGAQILGQAQVVMSEVAAIPLYVGQPLLDDQMRSLRQIGFDLHKFVHFQTMPIGSEALGALAKWRSRNQLTDGDAVFVNGLLALAAKDSEALKHLALLADAVFDSPDLTLRILQILAARADVAPDVAADYAQILG